jgi:4-carboxymuconolactone decarboxylase
MLQRYLSPGLLVACAAAAAVIGPVTANATAEVVVNKYDAAAGTPGPATNFTGEVRVESRFQAQSPGRVGGGTVTFQPGARTAWHTHPLGQTLIVTEGCGLVQNEGGVRQTIQPGDVVWIPPGVRHWHGASRDEAMTHVAVAESLDGSAVTWLEHVSDAEYAGTEPVDCGA